MRIIFDYNAGKTAIEDVEDLKRLDAILIGYTGSLAIDGIERSDADHIWFNIDALETLAGARTEQWRTDFKKMIAYAESKGWVDDKLKAVRVHIAS